MKYAGRYEIILAKKALWHDWKYPFAFALFYTVELLFHLVTYFSSRPFNPCACDTTCHKNKSFLGNLKDKKIWWNKNFLRALCLSVLGRAQKNARCYFFITFQNYPHPSLLLKQKWTASVFPTNIFELSEHQVKSC